MSRMSTRMPIRMMIFSSQPPMTTAPVVVGEVLAVKSTITTVNRTKPPPMPAPSRTPHTPGMPSLPPQTAREMAVRMPRAMRPARAAAISGMRGSSYLDFGAADSGWDGVGSTVLSSVTVGDVTCTPAGPDRHHGQDDGADEGEAEGQRHEGSGEHGGADGAVGHDGDPHVEDQHDAAVTVAHFQQAVVQVHLVRGEGRFTGPRAPDDGEREVKQRDGHGG